MKEFFDGDVDVLLSTTIVESELIILERILLSLIEQTS